MIVKPQRNVFRKTSMLCEKVLIGYKILGFKSLIGNGNKKMWPVLGCTGHLLDFGY
jgi:hypothetical protein